MQAPRNTFKRRLLAGDTQNGLWLSLGSPISSEALSLVGFDWLLFDTEHSPIDLASVQPLLQAAAVGTAQAVVRPAWNDKVLIKRVLDMGAQTLLVPFVETPEEAAAAVAATRYPPKGLRGVAGATRLAADRPWQKCALNLHIISGGIPCIKRKCLRLHYQTPPTF